MARDLIAFLTARLDEDEALAESGESWSAFDESVHGTRRVDVDHSFERVVACTRSWRGEHIARHDPARVLREIEAKRQILRHLADAEVTLSHTKKGDTLHDLMTGSVNSLAHAVRQLAAVYEQHPDYREEWKP